MQDFNFGSGGLLRLEPDIRGGNNLLDGLHSVHGAPLLRTDGTQAANSESQRTAGRSWLSDLATKRLGCQRAAVNRGCGGNGCGKRRGDV